MGAMRAGLALFMAAGCQAWLAISIRRRMGVVRDCRVSITPLLAVIACMSPHPIANAHSRPESAAMIAT